MGYSPWGHKELDTTERLTHTHTHTYVVSLSQVKRIVQISLLMGNTKKQRK